MNVIQEARGWARFAVAAWGPLETVDPGNPKTWRIDETLLPGGYRVVTDFNVVRYAPTWGMPGQPHHFETLVTNTQGDFGNAECTYYSEAEARDGHRVAVDRLRTALEARR